MREESLFKREVGYLRGALIEDLRKKLSRDCSVRGVLMEFIVIIPTTHESNS